MAAMKDFTNALRNAVESRRGNGESLEAIASRAGITRMYLYKLLNRQATPSLEVADQIGKKLGFRISVNVN